jgi:hypothetical protein
MEKLNSNQPQEWIEQDRLATMSLPAIDDTGYGRANALLETWVDAITGLGTWRHAGTGFF